MSDREWLIRKVQQVPFDSSMASIVGPETNTVSVVERASLDRVVEERDRLREELERLNRLWEEHNTCGLCPYRKAVQDENERLRAALRSGEGGTA